MHLRAAARLLPGLCLVLLLCGCATTAGLRPGPDGTPPSGGVTMLYPQSPEVVFPAASRCLISLGLFVVESNPARGYILAERGLNATSNGENVGVYIRARGEGSEVTVITTRKLATNLLARDHTGPMHMQLGAELGRLGQAAAPPAQPYQPPGGRAGQQDPRQPAPAAPPQPQAVPSYDI